MYVQKQLADYLRSLNASHLREEFYRPNLEYQVSYSAEILFDTEYVGGDAQFRVDGRNEERQPPAPLEYATIGSNGRDTATGQLHFIGLDIDGPNHSSGHTAETLNQYIERLRRFDWLQINRSRSGNGFHLFVFPATEIIGSDNSAVYSYGEAVKQFIADELGDESFLQLVDCAGSLMFFHAPNPGERGFELIKPATELFTAHLAPLHPAGDPTCDLHDLAELDETHKSHIDWLQKYHKKNFSQVESTLFQGHTSDVLALHEALTLSGKFATIASGSGDEKANCWFRAMPNGQWYVQRFGNTAEPTWNKSQRGSYYIYLNQPPALSEFLHSRNIPENRRGQSFTFNREQLQELCDLHNTTLPETAATYFHVVGSADKITIEIDIKPTDSLADGWQRVSKQKATFIIPLTAPPPISYDKVVRVAYSPDGKNFNYYRRVHGNHWQPTIYSDALTKLQTLPPGPCDPEKYLVNDTPYRLVNQPFKGEFPTRWEWNVGAVQLAFTPAKESGPYPHWQMILDHCGTGLNEVAASDPWCQEFGIKRGSDYLKLWAARMLRFPNKRLPGLAMFSGVQNCGKSTFPMSHGKLMTRRGYFLGESPLTSNFNQPLFGCCLWDLDDIDLSKQSGEAYQRLQSWLTNDSIAIEGKGKDALTVDNTTHIVHSANREQCFCIMPGDTRWTLWEVHPLDHEIPAETFMRSLMKEAPYYLKALFDLPMPTEAAGRFFLPFLDTPIKLKLIAERSAAGFSPEQSTLLSRIMLAANEGRLDDLTTHEQLKQLVGVEIDAQQFKVMWPKFEDVLNATGYKTAHRQNTNGRCPAAWSVTKI